jgi:hypothetical protein
MIIHTHTKHDVRRGAFHCGAFRAAQALLNALTNPWRIALRQLTSSAAIRPVALANANPLLYNPW